MARMGEFPRREPGGPAAPDVPPPGRAALAGVPERRRVGGSGRPGPATADNEPRMGPAEPALGPGGRGRGGTSRGRPAGEERFAVRSPRAWRATAAPVITGLGLCDGTRPHRRGARDRSHGRATHPAGPLRTGHGPSAPAPPHVRALPLRPAQFRDHCLSPGPQSAARGTAQPLRLVDQDRRGPGVEVDPGVHRAGTRRRADARADARDSDAAQPAPAAHARS